jgi:adenylate cyclase
MGVFDGIRRIFSNGPKPADAPPIPASALVAASAPAPAPTASTAASSAEPSIHLTIDGQTRVYPLAPFALCSIGRSEDNVIVVPAAAASRNHATVQRQAGDRCVITDLRSRNGTNVNGRRVEEKVLENGDRITIGTSELIYYGPELFAGIATPPVSEKTQFFVQSSLVTVMVIDIRDNVTWAKELGDDKWAELVMKLIEAARGILDSRHCSGQKYIGDAIMGVWEHKAEQIPNKELVEILSAVTDLQAAFSEMEASSNLPRPIRFGCGMNSGYAAIGNMAGQAALGDAVNKAFRLESATKELGCNLAVGKATFDYLVTPAAAGDLPEQQTVQVKGFPDPEAVFAFNFDQVPALASRISAIG